MNSYFGLIVVAAAIIGCVQSDKEEYKKIETECVTETGVDADLLAKALKGTFEDGSDFKCFPKCFFEKAGFMDANGDFVEDVIKAAHAEKPDADKRTPIIDECLTKKGGDACETGDLVFRCYWEAINEAGLND